MQKLFQSIPSDHANYINPIYRYINLVVIQPASVHFLTSSYFYKLLHFRKPAHFWRPLLFKNSEILVDSEDFPNDMVQFLETGAEMLGNA